MDGVMAVVSGIPNAERVQGELTRPSHAMPAAATSSMRVSLVDRADDFDQLRPHWERAFDRDPVAPIFQNWWWQRGWREVSPYPYAVLTVTPARTSEPVAFLPISVRGSANVLRVDHVREIHMGGDPGTDYNGLVCDPDHQEAVLAALVDHFSHRMSWDRLMLKEINDPRLLFVTERLPSDVADVFPRQGTCCPYTPLPATWEAFQQECLSYETRKSLRKKLRLCEDECRVTLMDSSNAAQHIEALVTLAKNRTRDDMDDNVHRCDWIFEWAAKGGIASILLVWHEQTPIAGMGAFIDKKANSYCFYLTGYNEKYGHYSPGRVVNALAIKHAIELGCTTLDFLRGDEPYKFQFGAQRRYTTHVVAVRKRLHSAARIAVENVRRRFNI
jgi:CelD/BcsL family acetyltransferase involved in cellulose biosynthesis